MTTYDDCMKKMPERLTAEGAWLAESERWLEEHPDAHQDAGKALAEVDPVDAIFSALAKLPTPEALDDPPEPIGNNVAYDNGWKAAMAHVEEVAQEREARGLPEVL